MYLEKFSLLNKSVIVTGATRGIGQAIAVALAEAGADVLGVGRSDHTETRNQVEAYGRRYVPMQLDIADEDAPEKIVHKAVESFGKVDILVNADRPVLLEPKSGPTIHSTRYGRKHHQYCIDAFLSRRISCDPLHGE